ncbi:hypothetical protein [Vibrio coralliirubri]|uniref:hypothetical protein n=1 Tax=Vibrio coralliirubri TaxID=1516159 RepID=UPI00076A867C|nr:hypothetical protein [Vibrio coralliirubri]
MIINQKPILAFLFLALLFSPLIPKFTLGGVFLGLDDFMAMLGLAFIFCVSYQNFKFEIPVVISPLLFFSICFLFLGFFQSQITLGFVKAPTEIWQYLKRFATFVIAYMFLKSCNKIEIVKITKLIIFLCFILLVIGILQLLSFDTLTSIYGRNERQIVAGLGSKLNQRIVGVSGFSTAWGGLCIFIFYTTIMCIYLNSFIIGKRKYHSLLLFSLLILTVINVTFSGSRGAIIAFGLSLFLFYILISTTVPLFYNICISTAFIVIMFIILYNFQDMIMDSLEFTIYRFEKLSETAGGGRGDQLMIGLSLIDDPLKFLFGVSNIVQRNLGVRWGIESEPVNIFVNYGFVGFSFVYGSFILILNNIRRKVRCISSDRVSFLYILWKSFLSGLIGMVVFSFGYFFYGEVIVGVFAWLIMGYVSGALLVLNNRSYN